MPVPLVHNLRERAPADAPSLPSSAWLPRLRHRQKASRESWWASGRRVHLPPMPHSAFTVANVPWHGVRARGHKRRASSRSLAGSYSVADRVLASERRAGSKCGGAFPGGKRACRRSVVVCDHLSPPGTGTSTETVPTGQRRRASHLARIGIPAHDLVRPRSRSVTAMLRDHAAPRRSGRVWRHPRL